MEATTDAFFKKFASKFFKYNERRSACNLTERSNFLLVFLNDFVFLPNHQIQILLRTSVFLFLEVGFFAGSDSKNCNISIWYFHVVLIFFT